MNKIIPELFDDFHDVVYLVDMDDYSLVYVNKACLRTLGYKSAEEVLGRKCFEVMRNFKNICSDCNNSSLCKGKYISRSIPNPLTKKYYSMHDTMIQDEGKVYRLSMASNLESEFHQFSKLVQMATMQRIVALSQAAALAREDPEDAINTLLRVLGEHLECDRVYIFEENEDGSCDNTYEWCAEGVTPEKDNLQKVPLKKVKNWYDVFDKKENVIIRDMESYRDIDPVAYAALKPQGIDALAAGRIELQGRRIGYFGVDNPPYNNIDYISFTYDILGNFIASLMNNRNLRRQEMQQEK